MMFAHDNETALARQTFALTVFYSAGERGNAAVSLSFAIAQWKELFVVGTAAEGGERARVEGGGGARGPEETHKSRIRRVEEVEGERERRSG